MKVSNSNEERDNTYSFKTENGRVKVYVNGYFMFAFNQLDFKGMYAFKDDVNLFGVTIYLMNDNGGATNMDIYFKTKTNWLAVLKLLDENM